MEAESVGLSRSLKEADDGGELVTGPISAKLKAVETQRAEEDAMRGYVDLYLLPVPKKKLSSYRRQARAFGKVARENGALSYREFIGEDLRHSGTQSLGEAVTMGRGEVLTAAVAEFKSRRHRDRVMKRVLADARVKRMMEQEPLANMKQMRYGGFETFVSV